MPTFSSLVGLDVVFKLLRRFYYFLCFLYSQFFVTPSYPIRHWTGKTVIVTGANRGIGAEAARHFVRLGADKVVLAVRDTHSGIEAKHSVEESTGRHGVVEVWALDLQSPESILAFVRRASESLPRLDAVVANAAIATPRFGLVGNRQESTIYTNVIGTFLLLVRLRPKLRATATEHPGARPTVTVVGSEVIFHSELPERSAPRIFDRLADPKSANMVMRYNASKVMAAMCVREMAASSADDDPIIINYVNPGLCHSDLLRELAIPGYLVKVFLARSTEVGSRVLVLGASAGPLSHGQYMSDGKVEDPPPFLESEDGAKTQTRVWSELIEILKEIDPKIDACL